MNKNQHRKLAAILFADIQGYTAMMQFKEAHAMEVLQRFQSVINSEVTKNNGELIKSYGDGSLLIFNSTIDAMRCAFAMQIAFQKSPKVPLRIGIHLGEVIKKEGDYFGNGINIAARIESIGVAGSVLFSKDVAKRIKNHPEYETVSMGSFEFKNVEEPMEVFALANEGFVIPKQAEIQGKGQQVSSSEKGIQKWINIAAGVFALLVAGYLFIQNQQTTTKVGDTLKVSPTLATTDKSIAVLPFENFNKDPEQQYFSDGISQDILTHLSGIKDLTVIAFNSSKQYRGSEQSSKEIGAALGVQHLLSGSVQRSGNQFRIRASLINTATDQQLWANNYDGQLANIFQVQSEVSTKIAEVLKAELLPTVATRIKEKPTENMEAWQEYSQGRYFFQQRGMDNYRLAEKHYLKAIHLDSTFAKAYAGLAQTYLSIAVRYPEYLEKGKQFAEKAIALDATISEAYSALANYSLQHKRNFAKTLSNNRKAIALDPSNANAYRGLSNALVIKGETEEGRAMHEIAKKLDPSSKSNEVWGYRLLMAEDKYDAAEPVLADYYKRFPNDESGAFFLALYYTNMGKYEKAKLIDNWDGYTAMKMTIIHHQDQHQLEELKALKIQIDQTYSGPRKDYLSYLAESAILLLEGALERYIHRMDSTYFVLGYFGLRDMQDFPPPDSIRLHPKFQEMMQKRGFTVRPRSAQLKAIKKEL